MEEDENETNRDVTRYIVCGKLLAYSGITCYFSNGSGMWHFADSGIVYTYNVQKFYSKRSVGSWEKEQIDFEGIYTGYLASAEQCHQICEFFDRFKKENTTIVVDPAMADNGKLYLAFDEKFPAEMAKVCAKADVIIPNITEAALLTGMPYKTEHDRAYVRELLERLLKLGCKTAAITGVSYEENKLGVAALDQEGKEFEYFTHKCAQSFHGTGDAYSSVVVGGLMRGLSLGDSLKLAADFVVACIEETMASEDARTYAVDFQNQIPFLCAELQKKLSNRD